MLKVEGLDAFYGVSQILFGLSLEVRAGEVVGLVGRNGSGKTTTLKSIVGLVSVRSGRVRFQDRDVTGLAPHRICRMGVGFVPEDRRIFPDLTVRENLEVAEAVNPWSNGMQWTVRRVCEIFPALGDLLDRRGRHLSGGEQQMLAIGRSLMTNPRLLLLDEPVEGLAPVIVSVLSDRLLELKKQGLTMLLSEQNLQFAQALTDRVYAIDRGEVKLEGSMGELMKNEELTRRYLTI